VRALVVRGASAVLNSLSNRTECNAGPEVVTPGWENGGRNLLPHPLNLSARVFFCVPATQSARIAAEAASITARGVRAAGGSEGPDGTNAGSAARIETHAGAKLATCSGRGAPPSPSVVQTRKRRRPGHRH
jgi:hypothetical protein